MSSAANMLAQAAKLVAGARDHTHGDKKLNHENIAALWNAYIVNRVRMCGQGNVPPYVTAHDAANMMELLKIARRQAGASNPDDYIDAAGYAACAFEIAGHK